MTGHAGGKRKAENKEHCEVCGGSFHARGFTKHYQACKARDEQVKRDEEATRRLRLEHKEEMRARKRARRRQPSPGPAPSPLASQPRLDQDAMAPASTSQVLVEDLDDLLNNQDEVPYSPVPAELAPPTELPQQQADAASSPHIGAHASNMPAPAQHSPTLRPIQSPTFDMARESESVFIPMHQLNAASLVERLPNTHDAPPLAFDTAENDQGSTASSPTVPISESVPRSEAFASSQCSHQIRTEWHPRANRSPVTMNHEDWVEAQTESTSEYTQDEVPWEPFDTEDDFELADFILKAGLTKTMTEKLLSLIKRVRNQESSLTIFDYDHLCKAWQNAAVMYPAFEEHTFTTTYHGPNKVDKDYTYNMPVRDLWGWCKSLIEDPALAKHFTWDAKKQYRSTDSGKSWEQFWTEPTSAGSFWEAYTSMPDGGSPLGIILYADTSKWSSFGTKKGHPIIARISNLDQSVRNGSGVARRLHG